MRRKDTWPLRQTSVVKNKLILTFPCPPTMITFFDISMVDGRYLDIDVDGCECTMSDE